MKEFTYKNRKVILSPHKYDHFSIVIGDKSYGIEKGLNKAIKQAKYLIDRADRYNKNPFESKARTRYMFLKHPTVARAMVRKTKSIRALPERITKKNPPNHVKGYISRKDKKQFSKSASIASAAKKNPPERMVKIYDDCLGIFAVKGKNSNFPGQSFVHEFKAGSGVKVYGLANGNILLAGNKKLWKVFSGY
jgi:hypothetical protein